VRRRWWPAVRLLGGAAILVLVVVRLGSGAFLDAFRTVDGWSLSVAAAVALLTTVCCAWRWSLVARGLGVGVPLPAAVAAYYRSQFLNTTLPGGVLGDLHRAVRSGRDAGDVGRGIRAVAWERGAGQVVQVVLAAAVLLLLPSPVRAGGPVVAGALLLAVLVGVLGVVLVARTTPRTALRPGSSPWGRAATTALGDLHDGLLTRRAWPGIVVASAVVVAGHVATFVIAARAAGTTVSLVRMLPLALLVLLAAALPTNIAGWGPREGAAAWAFSAAGLPAADGVAVAVVYGVLALVASLPGAAVLVAGRLGRDRATVGRRAGAAHG
jgi:glycosyltransferase 2 family protein